MKRIELSIKELMKAPVTGVLLPASRTRNQHFGFHMSSAKGKGMEFSEVRPYLPGDDVRHIDWRITAKTGKPHTKLFREERDRCEHIVLDLSPAMYFASRGQLKARAATLIAASAAWTAFAAKDKVGCHIIMPDELESLPPSGTRKDILRVINMMHRCYETGLRRARTRVTLESSLRYLCRSIRPGSVVHIISDFFSMSDAAALWLKRLNKLHIVYTYQVFDRLEVELAGRGSLLIDNGAEIGYITSDDSKFRQDYSQIGIHRMQTVSSMLKGSSSRYFGIDVSKGVPE